MVAYKQEFHEHIFDEQRWLPSRIYAVIAVNKGAEDFIVSENETATYFNAIIEQAIAPNL